MKLTKEYFESRAAAMKWLDTDVSRRDYGKGVGILTRSGYKPHVAALLLRKGRQDWTEEKLSLCLRELVQVYYNPSDPRFDNHVEDVDDLNDREGETVPVKTASMMVAQAADMKKVPDRWRQMPEVIQSLTRAFADAFKQRAKLNRRRALLGEGNETDVRDVRRRLSQEMDALTGYMDNLWKLRRAYDEHGTVPTTEQVACCLDDGDREHGAFVRKEPEQDNDLTSMPTARLRVRRKSIVTQLTRKRNLLRYQQATVGEVDNAMPDCPKRVKTERQITELTDELTRVEYELARRH